MAIVSHLQFVRRLFPKVFSLIAAFAYVFRSMGSIRFIKEFLQFFYHFKLLFDYFYNRLFKLSAVLISLENQRFTKI